MTVTDILLVCVTLLSPLIAVQVQKWIERSTERNRSRQQLFKTLMATRATRLATEHIQALNMISLEFGARPKVSNVIAKWRLYADHLNPPAPDTSQAWQAKADDLFLDLLESMSKSLGYDFDKVEIRRGIYYPNGQLKNDLDREIFNTEILKIVKGEKPLPISISATQEAHEQQKIIQERMAQCFSEDGAIKIHMDLHRKQDAKR
ncbi:hypothetical protein Rvan_0554 [Rhodomicrobium vannielii ATCC 17100]|uniref:DUF6680 domain-containing protein n=1 Tax=Rhodomicrobium vannielii (strain ATCC 17100 / DSM 162 / LMG 4299 / NCIMB 10020 / ATH 3.1.1) TaxID=648757 RepID=E3HYU4_RHOVT|nr:DUF6680 family protein [Rhodomicrobium vannielii]ADP69835.1 hypothetical protein Rvan_0554 [Rhodomicrobium vannielii ATCC 17100]